MGQSTISMTIFYVAFCMFTRGYKPLAMGCTSHEVFPAPGTCARRPHQGAMRPVVAGKIVEPMVNLWKMTKVLDDLLITLW